MAQQALTKTKSKSLSRTFSALSLAFLGLGSGIANAEESAVFAGVEVGYAASAFENKITVSATGFNQSQSAKYSGDGVKYGLVVGYKQFFTPSFWFALLCKYFFAPRRAKIKHRSKRLWLENKSQRHAYKLRRKYRCIGKFCRK